MKLLPVYLMHFNGKQFFYTLCLLICCFFFLLDCFVFSHIIIAINIIQDILYDMPQYEWLTKKICTPSRHNFQTQKNGLLFSLSFFVGVCSHQIYSYIVLFVGNMSMSHSEVSLGGHELIALVNRLRSIGAHLSLDLPTIVLCGQQSCGKSSVSESISGVPLPRNHGTCTRCPTEVRLIHSDTEDWKCTIKIRWEWDDLKRKFLNNVKEQEVGIVRTPIEVASLVTLAQRSLLDKAGVKFSRNVICVEVESTQCVDLTIVDLPGLIQAVENEIDARYIDLVRFLVEDYIRRPNTLIAAVIACNNDMENQLINHLIRKYDRYGSRTLGILTKVDIIEPELEQQWIDILCGRKYPLRLGYIAVRNLSSQELRNLNFAQNSIECFKKARDIETNFFLSHETWSMLDDKIQERLGSDNLINLLSKQLANLISSQLPRIRMTLVNELNELKSQLSELPEPPKLHGFENGVPRRHVDVKETLVDLILQFTDSCKTLVRTNDGELWQRVMVQYKEFFSRMESYQPQFVVSDKSKRRKEKENAFSVLDVIKECSSNGGRDIHFTASDSARKKFLTTSMKPWGITAQKLVFSISEILASVIAVAVKRHFIHFKNLHVDALKACQSLISELQTTTLHEVTQLLDREREQDEFTLSTHRLLGTYDRVRFQFEKAFPYDSLFKELEKLTLQSEKSQAHSHVVHSTPQNHKSNKSNSRNDESDCSWKNEQAITVMAQCVSYYDLGYRRFADNVAMAINSLLIKKFSKQIESSMFKSINILNGSTQELCKLLQEDPTITQRRNQIQSRTQTLSLFLDQLIELIPDNDCDSTTQITEQSETRGNDSETRSGLTVNKENESTDNDQQLQKRNSNEEEVDEYDEFENARKALKAHDRANGNTRKKTKTKKKDKKAKTKRKKLWNLFG